jgi:hypothetical protein
MLFAMTSRDRMRAADADREWAATRLREALEEGRLTLGELDDRLKEVYASKTFGDLDRLLADLPAPAAADRSEVAPVRPNLVPPSRYEPTPRLPGWLSLSWKLWFVAVSVNLVIWFLSSITSGQLLYFWPMWVAGPWAAVNVALMIFFPPRLRP